MRIQEAVTAKQRKGEADQEAAAKAEKMRHEASDTLVQRIGEAYQGPWLVDLDRVDAEFEARIAQARLGKPGRRKR